MLGTYVLSSGYYDAYYKRAMRVRTLIKKDFDEAFKKVDVIIGGPPCQGFSMAGNIGRKFIDDPRNNLFKEFIIFCFYLTNSTFGKFLNSLSPVRNFMLNFLASI